MKMCCPAPVTPVPADDRVDDNLVIGWRDPLPPAQRPAEDRRRDAAEDGVRTALICANFRTFPLEMS